MKVLKSMNLGIVIGVLLIEVCGTPVAKASDAVVIIGFITNLEEAKEYITKDTYLQLLLVPSDGGVGFSTDEQGRTTYTSELPRIDIPSDGYFMFKTINLKPGRYVIVAQCLEPYGLGRGGSQILALEGTKEFVIVDIPKEEKMSGLINVGNTFIPIP